MVGAQDMACVLGTEAKGLNWDWRLPGRCVCRAAAGAMMRMGVLAGDACAGDAARHRASEAAASREEAVS